MSARAWISGPAGRWLARGVDADIAPLATRDVLLAGQSNAQSLRSGIITNAMTGTVNLTTVAAGDTGFDNGWTPGQTYADQAAAALAGMKNPRAIGWVQGERDANSQSLTLAYPSNFECLCAYLWEAAGKVVPFFMVLLHASSTQTWATQFRTRQLWIAAKLRDVHAIDPDAITDYDGVHYGDTSGEILLSAILAAGMETQR